LEWWRSKLVRPREHCSRVLPPRPKIGLPGRQGSNQTAITGKLDDRPEQLARTQQFAVIGIPGVVREEVTLLMLDEGAEGAPAVGQGFMVTKAIQVGVAPELIAQAVANGIEQFVVHVIGEVEPKFPPDELACV